MNKFNRNYKEKEASYFNKIRKEIVPLIPAGSSKILEIGCGAGETLSYLKTTGHCDWAGGIELSPIAAQSAKEKLDWVLTGNIESDILPFEENSLDVILCLDVLEHLYDPWTVISKAHALLKPGGLLICSIPNIRHYRASLPLLFLGRWRYTDDGILDRTHLRFFTRESAVELVSSSGLRINFISSTGLGMWTKAGMVNIITLSIFKRLFEFQYLIRAIKDHSD